MRSPLMKTTLHEFKTNNLKIKLISFDGLGTNLILMVGEIESSITEGLGMKKRS